ncbi:ferrochelatase [Immundisolibacter sp.]|uniref:ferrochelatase n=1 Tax=Immundisolibacter sp. TaxID=1934948 RepID=UPI00198C47E5|nr:ferrochelatase [Immundisolibacter sp.]MBC7162406.1 ferrochelatase [Immundisolibacter sp.]MEA3219703.1 Ferrochelatase [Immundisolibacter sp.]
MSPRSGVLLVNLGSPAAPTPAAVRRYLKQFLSDRRVVDLPPLLWQPILRGIILTTRPRRSARLYQSVWTAEGAPLVVNTRRQAAGLATRLAGQGVAVAFAMSYGAPSLAEGLAQLAGCERVLVLPMFPQHSASTQGAVFDALAAALRPAMRLPTLHFVADFHDHPGYIDALAASVRAHWAAHGRGDRLLMSFHGLPQRNVDRGDPYAGQCMRTARLLADALELDDDQWQLAYQSRFGKARWLEPATDATLRAWGAQGLARVDLICPGFVADCLETLEEIAIGGRHIFQAAGGGQFQYIASLNDSPAWLDALADLVRAADRD